MRRKVVSLCVLLCVVATLAGCGLFGKKKTDVAMTEPVTPTTSESTFQPEPYAYPPAGAADSTYSGSTSTTMGGGRTHTVAKGDTLYKLARTYYGDQAKWKSIYEANRSANGSEPNKIRVGQRLVIP